MEKKITERFKSILEQTEEKIRELEYRTIEIIDSKEQKEKGV